jgi:hypothetical protein
MEKAMGAKTIYRPVREHRWSNGPEDFRNVFGPRLDYGKIRAIL